jgi:hypothetical protein
MEVQPPATSKLAAERVILTAQLGRQLQTKISRGEKDAKLAQKLGQLQPFIVVFPKDCMGQLAFFGPT